MSCYNQTFPSAAVLPLGNSDRAHRSAFIGTIVALIDAFQEALSMRRAAYRRYRLSDE
jgi:hypothetical protein